MNEKQNLSDLQTDNFILDFNEDQWFIRNGSKLFMGGTDKQKVQDLIKRLNGGHRPNVEQVDNMIFVCWNHHEKGEKCDWVCEI